MQPPEPITAGSLVSRSWAIYREDFFGYSLVILMFKAPSLGFSILLTHLGAGAEESLPILMAIMLFDFVLMPVAIAAVILGVFRGLRGPHIEFGEAVSLAWSRWLQVVGGSLLVAVATVVGLVLLIVPGVIALCGTIALIPAAVVEKLSVVRSWDRSWELTMGHRGAIFGGLATVIVLSLILGVVIAGALGPAGVFELPWLFALFNGLAGVIVQTWLVVLSALTYHDLRYASGDYSQNELAEVFA